MIKIILVFAVFWSIVTGMIYALRYMNGQERINIISTICYGATTAVIATAILSLFVFLF